MSEITLQITVDEANRILEGLGKLPFAEVYQLVAKVQTQASQQLGPELVNEAAQRTPVSAADPTADSEEAHVA